MKIAIDISPLKSGHQFRGIGSYTRNLIETLEKVDKKNQYLLTDHPERESRLDIIHYPFFSPFLLTLPLIKKCKAVVTIHDLIPLVFPKQYPPGIKGRIKFLIQKTLVNRIEAVITDSKNSKADIIKFLNINPGKIHVIYLAPSPGMEREKLSSAVIKDFRKKYCLPEKFVLYVGDVNYNKNILGLAKACKKIDVPLVLVGKQAAQTEFDQSHPENQSWFQFIKQYGKNPAVLRLGYVPTQDLITIYQIASVYCQPSFYEGFGLPVLEAMACGCPVVAANTSSLPEICGKAALMINPYQTHELVAGIKLVLNNPHQQRELQKRGLKQARIFSWVKTARETIKVYEQVYRKK